MKPNTRQQQTIDELVARMRADGWDNPTVAIRSLADEAAEFGNFNDDEIAAAGEGAIVVLRDGEVGEPDPDGNTFEIPDRGLIVTADGSFTA